MYKIQSSAKESRIRAAVANPAQYPRGKNVFSIDYAPMRLYFRKPFDTRPHKRNDCQSIFLVKFLAEWVFLCVALYLQIEKDLKYAAVPYSVWYFIGAAGCALIAVLEISTNLRTAQRHVWIGYILQQPSANLFCSHTASWSIHVLRCRRF